jgi:hypothetical protein
MSGAESLAARMAVEHATTSAVAMLRERGIPSVVLRGPTLVGLLYREEEARTSLDVDLLVPDLDTASAALISNGYQVSVDWTPGMERHAWTHVRENAVSIDLHRTLVGVDADPARVWSVFERESSTVDLGGAAVRVPGGVAQALTVVLHAAQHGAGTAQTMRDLERALESFAREVWERAAELARELDAEPAFHAGLTQLPSGSALAADLGLESSGSRRAAIRATYGTAEPAVLGLDALLTLRGSRRFAFVWGKVFPGADFMRERYPLARRGRVALAIAHGFRAGWILWRLPGGIRRLLSVRRRSR